MTKRESDWLEFEIVDIVRHTVWKCERPCGNAYRHRVEVPGLRPAICPLCGHSMRLVDRYWAYTARIEHHDF